LPEGVTILAPQAFLSDPVGGFSWWDVSTYPRGEDALISTREAIGEARSRLLSFLDNAVSYYKLAPRKVIALGFSQGAGLLSSVVQREPSRFSGVGLLAGFVIKEGEPAAFGALPPIFIGHGELDEVVPLALAHEGKSYLESRGHLTELHTDPVGHKLGSSGMRALKEWNLRVLA